MSIDFIVNGEKQDLKSISLSKNVTVFTGTFDPVHSGHIEVANQVLNYDIESKSSDLVLFCPHTFATKKHMSQLHDRVNYTSALLNYTNDMGVLVIDPEMQNKMRDQDEHWSKILFSTLSNYHALNYSRVISSERLGKIDSNNNSIPYFVCPREKPTTPQYIPDGVYVLEGTYKTHPISSTNLRNGKIKFSLLPEEIKPIARTLYPHGRF